jgi:hypothetical protein
MTRRDRGLTPEQYTQFAATLPQVCPTATFTLSGKTYDVTDAVALVDHIQGLLKAIEPARQAWLAAIAAADAALGKEGETIKALRGVVAAMFAHDVETLARLGITPKKPRRALSPEELVVAKERAAATRKARGTLGKRQRLKIKGQVTGVVITPVLVPPQAEAEPAGSYPPRAG